MKQPPIGIRNNNPLNIKYSASNSWQGQKGENGGFAVFTSQEYCFRAAKRILSKYFKRGLNTLQEIIPVWAPDGEKIVDNYIKYVSDHSHVAPNKVLFLENTETMTTVLYWMAKFECGGYPIDINRVIRGYKMR